MSYKALAELQGAFEEGHLQMKRLDEKQESRRRELLELERRVQEKSKVVSFKQKAIFAEDKRLEEIAKDLESAISRLEKEREAFAEDKARQDKVIAHHKANVKRMEELESAILALEKENAALLNVNKDLKDKVYLAREEVARLTAENEALAKEGDVFSECASQAMVLAEKMRKSTEALISKTEVATEKIRNDLQGMNEEPVATENYIESPPLDDVVPDGRITSIEQGKLDRLKRLEGVLSTNEDVLAVDPEHENVRHDILDQDLQDQEEASLESSENVSHYDTKTIAEDDLEMEEVFYDEAPDVDIESFAVEAVREEVNILVRELERAGHGEIAPEENRVSSKNLSKEYVFDFSEDMPFYEITRHIEEPRGVEKALGKIRKIHDHITFEYDRATHTIKAAQYFTSNMRIPLIVQEAERIGALLDDL